VCSAQSAVAQSTLEYAILIAVVISALLSIQIYLKRGVSGRLRTSADSIGDQYAPRTTSANVTLKVKSDTVTTSKLKKDQSVGGQKVDVMETETKINQETTERTGTETVGPLGTNLFD